ncbi:hypothetical protein G6M89_10545 [Natronolimnobius sp. AArcel1]|uniref:DUF7289 family protein n=1 Tax=Natronolimnobius sp. AArcel1 TaxID=1679093 RepID=UPI0013ED4986|nr:archaellin/type IV pilin N-terminal domain-containing protein [Natronolimnobius sp. AArcel1]NGM69438.1 hypothetical protein [Natronolimnobius sp. AArcel1]
MTERTGTITGGDNDRGVTPLVGVVLLIGMVFVGAILVGITGWVVMDSLSSESDAESTYSTVEATDHGITTAASTREMQTIPWDGANYVDDGEVYIAWYDDDISSNHNVSIDPIGAIEYELADRTVVYQSGATWEIQDDDMQVTSGPNIGYDDSTLQLYFTTLSQDAVSGSEAIVEPSPDRELAEDIEDTKNNATQDGYNNLSLIVDSKYHDSWHSHLDSAFDAEDENITIQRDGAGAPFIDNSETAINVTIKNATETDPPEFLVAEDYGLSGDQYAEENIFVQSPDGMTFEADIENKGDERQTQPVEVAIKEDGEEIVGPEGLDVSIDGGDSKTVGIDVTEYTGTDLDFGNEYNYTISTDDDTTDNGSIYYAKTEDPHLNVTKPEVNDADASDENSPVSADSSSENVSLSADITNIGAENITDSDVRVGVQTLDDEVENAYGTDPYGLEDAEPVSVDRTYGENGTVTWNVSREDLFELEHKFTVTAVESDESATGYFDVSEAIEAGDTELFTPPNSEVDVSVIGTELGYTPQQVCLEPVGRFGCAEHGYQVDWIPATTSIYTQAVDEDGDPIDENEDPERRDGMEWSGDNLNQWDDRLSTFDHSFTTEDDERVSLMVQGTSYMECHDWQVGGEETINGVTYQHRNCPSGSEHNELVDLTADTQTEETNVRVLSEESNTMPELDPGNDVQLPANELLERDEVDIDVSENPDGSAELDLDENEFVFVFEVTHHPQQYNTGPELNDPEISADDYWQEAHERSGDPNFNDVLVHVEIEPGGEGIDPEDAVFDPSAENGIAPSVGTGEGSDGEHSSWSEDSVEVGSDEIIIG